MLIKNPCGGIWGGVELFHEFIMMNVLVLSRLAMFLNLVKFPEVNFVGE